MNSNNLLTRRQFTGVLAGGAIGALAGRTCLAATADPAAFFFIVAADPQLFWGSAEDWARAVGHINRLRSRFAVICGDLINRNGDSKKVDLEADEKMVQAYLEVARTVAGDIPLYNVAGNHDVCNQPTPDSLAWYEKRFGKLWYSFTQGDCLFIVIESDIIKSPDTAPDATARQMAWLHETLEKSAGRTYRHKIVFMHHPMCLSAVDENDQYFNLPKTRRAELLALFHKHGVVATFSGHHHRNHLVKDGDLELITTGIVR